jgi:hypothetical protein
MARSDAVVLGPALIVLVVAGAQPSPTDFCNASFFAQTSGDAAYSVKSNRYCDGAVFQPNAGSGELPVIGVAAGPVTGDPSAQALKISTLPLPQGRNPEPVIRLQGIARSKDTNYRLDAGLFAGTPLTIAGESAMAQASPRLSAGEIAWSAWTDDTASGRTYHPVISGSQWSYVEITVRPSISVASINYSAVDLNNKTIVAQTTVAGPAKRGDPVAIKVPGGPPAIVVVKIVAVGNTGATQAAGFRMYRPGA